MDQDVLSLTSCRLCPRQCGVNRRAGGRGACRAGDRLQVYRYGPHHGEEPPLSGTRGSGTIFFSRCTLRCLYCQNYPWSQDGEGEYREGKDLVEIVKGLARAGCHNINLVSPTPWLPWIVPALADAEKDGIRLPVVYNTSGFERPEVIRALDGVVDIYLTDLRYAEARSAEAGSGAASYADVARVALKRMWEQVGALECDAGGLARRGVICRLLVLPGRADEAAANLRWIAEEIGSGVAVSVMCQYVPAYRAPGEAGWDRRVTREEYAGVCAEVERLGFSEGFVQEFDMESPRELIGYRMSPVGGGGDR